MHTLSRRQLLGALSTSLLALANAEKSTKNFDVLDYVDPLIGTANGGHVFPGATLPYAMVKAVADTVGENQAGFAYDTSVVTGFSHMHDDGTGGSPSMGNFPIFPQPNCPDDDLNKCKWQQDARETAWIPESPKARPGFFSIDLANGVHAEMTTTNRSALYRFTFNEYDGALNPVVLVDIMDLPQLRTNGSAAVDPETGRLTGNGTFAPSFGQGTYDMHFCVDFKGAKLRDTGVWSQNRAGFEPKNVKIEPSGTIDASTNSAGSFVRFHKPADGKSIMARAGVSFIGVDQACANAEKEQPDYDFEGTVKAAEDAWREKLKVISVDAEGVSKELQEVFWSGAYRTMISPQDYTGENPLWESDEPYYDSFYCIWDSYRSIHPLLTIMDPVAQSLMVRSLLDIYRHEGFLPDCRMSLCKGYTQGGSNADVLIADAFLKKVSGIDWDTAYEAVVKDAEVEPANWDVEGRGGIRSWKKLGYIPEDNYDPDGTGTETRSVSRTVEYAYNDFCIAEMAKEMGHKKDYEKYIKSSSNWKNLFKKDQTSSLNGEDTGFTGFLEPRYMNGTWAYQDPVFCSPLLNFTSCYLDPNGHETYEGSSWLYSFYAPQDMGSLITHLGGRETFVKRLDYLHESGILYIGDEQAFLNVWQYHYAGRPALSAKRSHFYIPSQFNTTVNGLPGNDDSGAMGSFAVLTMMGIWPVPGQDVYLIGVPFFKEVSIKNSETGKTATIRNINFDPEYKNIYIQNVKRDGKPWTKNWITHDFFTEGGVLELELGPEESKWGTRIEDLPPSLKTLGHALQKLGLPTYHGWDIIFEENPGYIQEWTHLPRRKCKGTPDGDVHITTAEFDALIGHVEAVIDICASAFAAEFIQAYPEAKVILNTRKDLDAWHRSATKTIVHEIEDRVFLWILRLFSPHFFWCWEMFIVYGFAGLFRASSPKRGIMYNGKWVYREHCNMIRGLVPTNRLLEWSFEDGWGPLYKFLGKVPPDEPFPKTNDPIEFSKRVKRLVKRQFVNAIRNMFLLLGSFVFLVTAIGFRIKDGEWKAPSPIWKRQVGND